MIRTWIWQDKVEPDFEARMHLWALRPGIDHRFRALTAGHMTLCSSLIQLLHASTKCAGTCTFTTSARAGCHNLEHLFYAEAACFATMLLQLIKLYLPSSLRLVHGQGISVRST